MHSAMIIRAIAVASLIVVISPFIPSILNLGDVKFNYALLAIVPLVNGFSHLDHQRFHRRQFYTVSAKIGLTADLLSVLVAVVCVAIWDSYWAFYASFLFRHTTSTLLSHLWARRPYALAFNIKHLKLLLKFGVPLLIVGLLKYIGIEMDKAIVARFVGLDSFTTYVLTVLIVVNGANFVTVALSKIFIRRVSIAKTHIAETVKTNGIINCFLVIPILVVLGILGEDLMSLIFGLQYTRAPFLIVAVCAIVGLRALNQWLNQTVIASAPTQLMLMADISRVIGAIFGVWLVYTSGDLLKITMAFWFAEILYFITLTLLLQKRFAILKTSISILCIYLVCLSGLLWVYNTSHLSSELVKIGLTLATLSLFYLAFLVFSETCRSQSMALLRPIMIRLGF